MARLNLRLQAVLMADLDDFSRWNLLQGRASVRYYGLTCARLVKIPSR